MVGRRYPTFYVYEQQSSLPPLTAAPPRRCPDGMVSDGGALGAPEAACRFPKPSLNIENAPGANSTSANSTSANSTVVDLIDMAAANSTNAGRTDTAGTVADLIGMPAANSTEATLPNTAVANSTESNPKDTNPTTTVAKGGA